MIDDVLPRVEWDDYRRGLCLLDPYGLHLDWEVINTAGRLKTIDMFLNVPIADMNREEQSNRPEAGLGLDPINLWSPTIDEINMVRNTDLTYGAKMSAAEADDPDEPCSGFETGTPKELS